MVPSGSADCPVEWNIERRRGENEKPAEGGGKGVEEERGRGKGSRGGGELCEVDEAEEEKSEGVRAVLLNGGGKSEWMKVKSGSGSEG